MLLAIIKFIYLNFSDIIFSDQPGIKEIFEERQSLVAKTIQNSAAAIMDGFKSETIANQ
ncbi:MAG: hypothetical protein AAF298_13475 [Cyanobacteria bacterium P01_A01_bin.40]